MSSPLLRFTCLAGLIAALASAGPPSLIAIKDAKIVPVSGPVIEKGTVVLRDGKIADVGSGVAVPAGAWVIEGTGLTVYPGFTDALSAWGIPESAAPAATPPGSGRGGGGGQQAPPANTPRSRGPEDRPGTNSWVKAADLALTSDRRLETARSAGFTTAVTFPKLGIVGGHGAVLALGGETAGRMVIHPSAALYVSVTGRGFVGFPSSLMGVLSYLRQLWIDADHYRLAKEQYEKNTAGLERPEYDRALEGILETKRILLPAASRVQLERMARFGAELKKQTILYGGHEAFRAADQLKKYSVPVIVNVKWPEKGREADPADEDSLRELELRDRAPSSPAALAAAGVPFAFTSDGLTAPKDLLRGIKKAIDAGLKPEQAIRALTLTPAEIYGVADRLGSIQPGKIANLTIFKGDPFAENSTVEMVFVDGVKYLPVPDPPSPAGTGGSGSPRPTAAAPEVLQ